jgi:hypothetical protein
MPSLTPFLALVPILARGVWSDQPIYHDNMYSQYTDTHAPGSVLVSLLSLEKAVRFSLIACSGRSNSCVCRRSIRGGTFLISAVVSPVPQNNTGVQYGIDYGRQLPRPETLQPTLDKDLPHYKPVDAYSLNGNYTFASSDVLTELGNNILREVRLPCQEDGNRTDGSTSSIVTTPIFTFTTLRRMLAPPGPRSSAKGPFKPYSCLAS